MEEQLAVAVAADVAAQEVRQRLEQRLAHGLEAGELSDVGEEPLAHAEGLRVLGAAARRRGSHVRDRNVGADAVEHARPLDLSIDRTRPLPVKHLTRLVETCTTTVGALHQRAVERLPLLEQGFAEQVGAACHACE